MKPKNRIVCPEIGRQKMLFETEEKAQRFIAFNNDDIKHGEKLRHYYCEACGGWHITHLRYSKTFEGKTDKLIAAYERSKQHINIKKQ